MCDTVISSKSQHVLYLRMEFFLRVLMMKYFLEQTINAEDLLLNNNTDCTVSSEIPEEDDSDILKANSLPSVPDPEFCVRTTKYFTAQGKSKELKKELSENCY